MVDKRILDDYFDWMLTEIGFYSPKHRRYEILLRELNSIEFKWIIPMDENRSMDGYDLRKEFLFDCRYHRANIWNLPVTVLEVLVAFSRRIEIEITGEPGNDNLGRWFWVMLENLGLLEFDDLRFNKRKVDGIIEKWLSRTYQKNGKGSIFPVKKVATDQREVEMWYQMHGYLSENWTF